MVVGSARVSSCKPGPRLVAGGQRCPPRPPNLGIWGRGKWQASRATELGPTCGTVEGAFLKRRFGNKQTDGTSLVS